MAGLCNDLGQGVHSHFFDRMLIPSFAPDLKWSYKDASVMLLENMIDQNNIEFDSPNLKKVIELINGPSSDTTSYFPKEKGWLFDIASNKRNAIDADKFDYIQRDIHNLGLLRNKFDPFRLIYSCKVLEGRVCYHIKNYDYLNNFF